MLYILLTQVNGRKNIADGVAFTTSCCNLLKLIRSETRPLFVAVIPITSRRLFQKKKVSLLLFLYTAFSLLFLENIINENDTLHEIGESSLGRQMAAYD